MREPFVFGSMAAEPSSFDLQFFRNGHLYQYGFKVNQKFVTEEWLIKLVGKKEEIIYERTTDDSGGVVIDAPGLQDNEKVQYLAKIGGRGNQTFLATAKAILNANDLSGHIGNVIQWFEKNLQLINSEMAVGPVGYLLAEDLKFRQFAGEFLQASSTGIHTLEVEKKEISEQDLKKLMPHDFFMHVLKKLEENPQKSFVIPFLNDNELIVEKTNSNHFYQISIRASHHPAGADVVLLELNEESDGTRRLLELLPALRMKKTGGAVYFIDEIDRSMHPLLIWKFVEYFLQSCQKQESQIIVTTHESNLLDLALLRRDEIWFAEKDATLSTHLYSLSDFKIRTDLDIKKHYFNGRFGAVPFLGKLDNLPPFSSHITP